MVLSIRRCFRSTPSSGRELEKSGPFKSVRVLKPDEAVPEGAYLAGFGAGKSSVKVAGSVKDSAGKSSRRSTSAGSAMGMGGGDSLGKLMSDSRSIGDDIARFLAKWAKGESLE